MASNSIKVFVKLRPLIEREKHENAASVWKLSGKTLKSTNKEYEMTFGEWKSSNYLISEIRKSSCLRDLFITTTTDGFDNDIRLFDLDSVRVLLIVLSPFSDNIYDETHTTKELFDDLAKPIVTSALKGINGTIFAYGQTSSGKVS